MTQSFITMQNMFHITALGGGRKVNVTAFGKIILYGLQACQSETVFDNKVQELPVHNKAKISLLHMHVTGHTKSTLVL